MWTTISKLFFTVMLSLLAVSCINFNNHVKVNGKGSVKTKTYPLTEEFSTLKVSNGWEVELIEANENKLEIEANENLVDNLQYTNKDGTLSIYFSKEKQIGRARAKRIKVFYTATITKIKVASGSELSSKETFKQKNLTIAASSGAEINLRLKTKNVDVDSSSGAEVSLQGTSINFDGNASSGSEIEAKELETKNSSARASSGADIEISVEKKLTAKVSSGASIDYYGNPKDTNLNRSSAGSIEQK